MLGLLDSVEHATSMAFRSEGDVVYLLGRPQSGDAALLAGSEYLALMYDELGGRPAIDLDLEGRVQQVCLAAIRRGLVRSAHDCSDGGLAVAVAESCMSGGIGLDASGLTVEARADAWLFGEAQSRIVVSVAANDAAALEALAGEHGVPAARLGVVGGDRLQIAGVVDVAVADVREAYEGGLAKALAALAPAVG
jgi:phosphoribosylformylglycinamidine synthase